MGSIGIVVADPAPDPGSCLAAGVEGIEEDAFVLQRPPQALDEDVVHPTAAATHRDADTGIAQRVGESEAGELAALVGVEDAGPAVTGDRFLQRFDTEVGVHRVREIPGQNLPAGPVHNRHEVEEPSSHRDISHVGTPDLVRLLDGQMAQQIRIDLVLRVRLAGLRMLIDRC